jgi:hypothetical protein
VRARQAALLRQEFTQLLAANQLHGDEADAVDLVDFVDEGDIGMLERRRRLRFLDEALPPLRVLREFLRKNLQRDVTIAPHVSRAIHDAHTAATDFFAESVMRQHLSRHAVLYYERNTARGIGCTAVD